MSNKQLYSLLESARERQDIYIIARAALMLQGRGCSVALTENEKTTIFQCLENSRKKKGALGLEPGYELARWILICRYLFPEEEISLFKEDIKMIQEACDSYINDRILKQIASIIHMSQVLGIEINLNRLPLKKRRWVEKLAATLS